MCFPTWMCGETLIQKCCKSVSWFSWMFSSPRVVCFEPSPFVNVVTPCILSIWSYELNIVTSLTHISYELNIINPQKKTTFTVEWRNHEKYRVLKGATHNLRIIFHGYSIDCDWQCHVTVLTASRFEPRDFQAMTSSSQWW